MSTSKLLVAVAAAAAVGCGGGYSGSSSTPAPTPTPSATPSPGPTTTSTFTITISGMRFSPLELHVPRGATVTVVNQDGAMAHSVTSEATLGAYTPGGVGGVQFDTGAFTGTRTFSIPANAVSGTRVPYYCSTHLGTMLTPNGAIVVDDSATPSTSETPVPAGGPMGY